jgi:hypothetical protein
MPRGRPRKKQRNVLLKTAELIGWAIGGIEREIAQTRERLASLTAQAAKLRQRAGLRASAAASSLAGAVAPSGQPAAAGRKRRRRKMSPEARKKISEMMKKRWAERRKGK